jgi:hypothetical protein
MKTVHVRNVLCTCNQLREANEACYSLMVCQSGASVSTAAAWLRLACTALDGCCTPCQPQHRLCYICSGLQTRHG